LFYQIREIGTYGIEKTLSRIFQKGFFIFKKIQLTPYPEFISRGMRQQQQQQQHISIRAIMSLLIFILFYSISSYTKKQQKMPFQVSLWKGIFHCIQTIIYIISTLPELDSGNNNNSTSTKN